MAVSSCKLFDETASWRSKDDVINMTKAATSAGDIFDNKNQLDVNCNNEIRKCPIAVNRSALNNNRSPDKDAMSQTEAEQSFSDEQSRLSTTERKFVETESVIDQTSTLTTNTKSGNVATEYMGEDIAVTPNMPAATVNMQDHIVESTDIVEKKDQLTDHQSSVTESVTACKDDSSLREDEGQTEKTDAREDTKNPDGWIEERFRVDRKKLEQMLQAAVNGKGQTGEDFFGKVMSETDTQITWPSKLKIGAKSKKDPHIKVSGKQEDVARAKLLVMQVLDTKCTRVTLKMDVSHTEHSHVIGKGGNNIKRVMEETGCHIHFPDSNRNSAAEKSNQVSIAGQPAGVELARGKIRELLPIVVTFDISLSGTIPDPNSTPIQQIVQAYSISVQFKQRMNRYCTTICTVRGSNDNMSGLVEGTIKLMQHLTGGRIVPVTSQIEVAPQQHSYMKGKNESNLKQIRQHTDAQIIFPDSNFVPKKGTILITGAVQSVVVARQLLMGCLPLVLMFDMKQDDNVSSNDEALKNSQLTEALDVFISVKLKPKQPSKSVIVKSVEKNIHNMFEARRQLLQLTSSGLKTPPSSLSSLIVPSTNSLTTSPMIHLNHTSAHIKPQYIGIFPPNNVALVNGSVSPLPRTTTPNALLKPNWAHSPIPSPSQSPYPMSQHQAVAAIQAHQQQQQQQQQQRMLIQAQINATAIASHHSSLAGSPPLQRPGDVEIPSDPMQLTRQFIQENIETQHDQFPLKHADAAAALLLDAARSEAQQRHIKETENWCAAPDSGETSPTSQFYDRRHIPGNVRGLQRQVLAVQKCMKGRISANNSFNKGDSERSISHSHSFSDSKVHREEFPTVKPRPRYSLAEGMDNVPSSFLQVNSQTLKGFPNRSPPRSDGNSPMSERMTDFSTISPEINNAGELNKQAGSHLHSPHASGSSNDLQPLLRKLRNSPTRSKYLHPETLTEQLPLGRMETQYASVADKREGQRAEFYQGESPAPPPGFSDFPKSAHSPLAESDYEILRQRAYEAMQKGPVASEVRTPTVVWAGKGFSKSMPSQEWKRLGFDDKFRQNLDTAYEIRDELALQEDAESVEVNPLTMSQHLANSSKGSSALQSWRERNNYNLSRSRELGNAIPQRRQHSTFDPLKVEYVQQSLPPPPHPNDDTNSVASYPGNEEAISRLQPPYVSNHPLEAALSLLTNNHLGGRSNSVELHDLLSHLNLEKYSEVFAKQEIDLQTFLTLTESDLTELGIKVFGPKRKILLAIEELRKNRNVLYGNSLSAAPGGPTVLRSNQPPIENGSSFLDSQGRPTSPSSTMRPSPAHFPSNKLLLNARGIVSQSGRW